LLRSRRAQSDAAATVGTSQRQWSVKGDDFETAAANLVANVLIPSGFDPLRIVYARQASNRRGSSLVCCLA